MGLTERCSGLSLDSGVAGVGGGGAVLPCLTLCSRAFMITGCSEVPAKAVSHPPHPPPPPPEGEGECEGPGLLSEGPASKWYLGLELT